MLGLAFAALALFAPPDALGAARVGEAAPPFVLRDLAGGERSLASLRGRVVCLDFWATWCGACANELPDLARLGARYAKDGVSVVAVSIDRRDDLVARYVAEHLAEAQRDGSIEILRDPDGDVLATYGAGGMPALYLIDRDGTVRAETSGYSEAEFAQFEKDVAGLLGAPVKSEAPPPGGP
jgi:thiol-disulfide isomerase/thioredoxin